MGQKCVTFKRFVVVVAVGQELLSCSVIIHEQLHPGSCVCTHLTQTCQHKSHFYRHEERPVLLCSGLARINCKQSVYDT